MPAVSANIKMISPHGHLRFLFSGDLYNWVVSRVLIQIIWYFLMIFFNMVLIIYMMSHEQKAIERKNKLIEFIRTV